MKVRHLISLLLTLLLPLMAAGQEIPDAGQQTPAAGPGIGAPSAVSYNTLNLPERYVFAAGDTTSCTYNAAGEKLRVSYSTQTLRPIDFALGGSVISPQGGGMTPGDPIIVQPCVTTTYDYCGNLVYQDGVLKYLLVDGGFVTFTKTGTGSDATYIPTYHAYLRDHLGSNRVVASSTGSAEQVYHYYPYGSMFNGGNMLGTTTTPSQPWLYCNKELDTMHGLGWYDSKARTYDPVLGIFPQMDPMAEKYHPWSPYVYCMGNPVRFSDPYGTDGWDKVVGYTIGTVTCLLPLSGGIRDVYTPNDPDDYNGALRTIDNAAVVAGDITAITGTGAIATGVIAGSSGGIVTVTSGGTTAPVSIPVAATGVVVEKVGVALTALGVNITMNASANKSAGYDRGKKSESSGKSINQLRKDVEKGKAPKEIDRFDKGCKENHEQDHVHLKNGTAINKDGTLKHGKDYDLNKKTLNYLKENGWIIPN